jgi:hypothetical protein
VVLIHHPPIDRRIRVRQLRDGLVDAARFCEVLRRLERGLVLFGHTHVRARCRLITATGSLDVVSASGAALDHPRDSVRAGFNLYEIGDDGNIASIDSHVIDPADPSGRTLRPAPILEREGCV